MDHVNVGVLAASLLTLSLAGCIGTGDTVEPDAALVGLGSITAPDRAVAATYGLTWAGGPLVGPDAHPNGQWRPFPCLVHECIPHEPVPCEPANCETMAFDLEVPSEGGPFVLEASMRWPSASDLWFDLEVRDASDQVVAMGEHAFMFPTGRTALVENPTSGTYTVVIKAVSGEGPYEAVVQLDERPAASPVRDLLPDLITLPPTDLQIRTPDTGTLGYLPVIPPPASGLAATVFDAPGCTWEEAALLGAKRCLRFSNAPANIGEGPLEVYIPIGTATSGKFVQRVFQSDGSIREVDAGPAEFHAFHGHWHNAASNSYNVYEYDLDTGARGAEVGTGRKPGVCFADFGPVDLYHPNAHMPAYDGMTCLRPAGGSEWMTGLTPNYYDSYSWVLNEQYVELGDAPDGVYLLCSTSNGEGHLLESDLSNNEACTAFRLTGNEVETLDPLPYHAEANGSR